MPGKYSRLDSKTKNVELISKQALGNTLRSWASLDEFLKSGYEGPTTIRNHKIIGASNCVTHIPAQEVQNIVKFKKERDGLWFLESAPDHRLIMQGELYNSPIPVMRCSIHKSPMRKAMANHSFHIYGSTIRLNMRRYLTPSSYDDLETLLDIYPDHVLELGIYEQLLGCLPGRNMVVWEVRYY